MGVMGASGQVVVLASADGGSLIVDGGVVIVAGPPGPVGPAGQVVVLSTVDGGTIVIDGGVAIVVGPVGPQGVQGTAGQSVVGSSEPAGTNCAAGGVRLVSASGTAYACNGAQGSPGQSVGFAVENPGTTCPAGGVRLIGASGTSIVCNGTPGTQGQQGIQGQPGQTLFVFAADGGSTAIDGGVVVVAGPQGVQGIAGPPGGIRVLALDGGLLGYSTGTDFYSVRAGCFTGIDALSPSPASSFGNLCFPQAGCAGTPHMVSLTMTASFGSNLNVPWISPVGRCFTGAISLNGGVSFNDRTYRLAFPLQRVVFNGQSCAIRSGGAWTCQAISSPDGFRVVDVTGLPPTSFPPEEDVTVEP